VKFLVDAQLPRRLARELAASGHDPVHTSICPAKVLSEITRDALELSPAQRRTLARILLEVSEDSLDFSPELEAVWDEEIVRRLQAVEAGTAKSRSAEEVFAELDRRFPR
jgi:hypothetical protein